MRQVMKFVLLLAALFCVTHATAETLDQASFEPGEDPCLWFPVVSHDFDEYSDVAQTFTVGISGLLTRLEVLVIRNSSNPDGAYMTVTIRPVDAAGAPLMDDNSALVTVDLPASSLPIYSLGGPETPPTSIVLGAGVPVTAGTRLAVTFRASLASAYELYAASTEIQAPQFACLEGDRYAGGALHYRSDFFMDVPQWSATNVDAALRTFVVPEMASATDTRQVPMPLPVVVVLAGLLAILGCAHRARR